MKDYISAFSNHLEDALSIGENTIFSPVNKKIKSVLICGLGGSGIGGTILSDIVSLKTDVPIVSTKDYNIPNFVNKNTLVVVSSYSGNTEETLFALEKCEKKKAEIAIITSGGKLKKLSKEKKYNCISIPEGGPPRAMFGYSFPQLFFVFYYYGLISESFKDDFKNSISLITKYADNIKKEAFFLAENLYGKTPVIYVVAGFEGVAIRFRQQINENSKMLCWHHVIPEMNHNELLGWRTNVSNLAVVYFRNNSDYNRNQIRIEINKKIISKYTKNITEVWSQGDSIIENTLYHIHLGDWVSWYLSEMNKVDAVEIDVINFLKAELGKQK